MDEDMQKIIEESRKLLTRPWEEVQAEIRKRQTLGKLPPQVQMAPQEETPEKFTKLPPAKPPI